MEVLFFIFVVIPAVMLLVFPILQILGLLIGLLAKLFK